MPECVRLTYTKHQCKFCHNFEHKNEQVVKKHEVVCGTAVTRAPLGVEALRKRRDKKRTKNGTNHAASTSETGPIGSFDVTHLAAYINGEIDENPDESGRGGSVAAGDGADSGGGGGSVAGGDGSDSGGGGGSVTAETLMTTEDSVTACEDFGMLTWDAALLMTKDNFVTPLDDFGMSAAHLSPSVTTREDFVKASDFLTAQEASVTAREASVTTREDFLKALKSVTEREAYVTKREGELLTREEALLTQEKRFLAWENSVKNSLEFHDKALSTRAEALLAWDKAMVLREESVLAREASLTRDMAKHEGTMLTCWKNVLALEARVLAREQDVLAREKMLAHD